MSLASHMSLASLRQERKSNGQYSVLATTQIGSPQTQQVRSQWQVLLTHNTIFNFYFWETYLVHLRLTKFSLLTEQFCLALSEKQLQGVDDDLSIWEFPNLKIIKMNHLRFLRSSMTGSSSSSSEASSVTLRVSRIDADFLQFRVGGDVHSDECDESTINFLAVFLLLRACSTPAGLTGISSSTLISGPVGTSSEESTFAVSSNTGSTLFTVEIPVPSTTMPSS